MEAALEVGFRADLIVNRMVIVELKSLEAAAPVQKKQLLTYLRLAEMRVGLPINLNKELLKSGIHRVVDGLAERRRAWAGKRSDRHEPLGVLCASA